MIITNTVWRIAGISGLFAMSILASDPPSSNTTDNSHAGIARNPNEVSLKPPQPASGVSPAPKKRNEEEPQPNLENEVASEPFAEPTPISQTMNGQAGIAQNPNKVSLKPAQPASGVSPAPKKRNEEKPQPDLENEVALEPFAEPTPISRTMSSSAATIATVSAVPKPTPSQNVTINLINRLVERHVLTQADATELIKQAEEDAAAARVMAVKQSESQPSGAEEVASQFSAEPPPSSAPELNPTADGEDAVSVSYVPEIVKEQLREEIKQDVMEQARQENWANPRIFPTWALHITPFADLRLRYEGIFYPSGNDDTGAFPNFNAINTGPPFDVTGTTFSPQLNVNKDRERARIRARFGAEMDLGDGFTMGLRIATGETNTPTSTNQTLGVANNAQGGNFSKYAIWLDRAFARYQLEGEPGRDFVAEVGRFDNPYFGVSELMWDEDLGWDGLALTGRYRIPLWQETARSKVTGKDGTIAVEEAARPTSIGITPFATVGIFPVFNTELNFSSNRPDKFSSEDKFLYGGQLGLNLQLGKDLTANVAGAFYDFYNIEGKLSDPFVPLTPSDQGNTDDSRPSFAQNGNTYFPIRDIIPTVDNGFGTKDQFQYFGLATPFRVVDVTSSLDYGHFDPIHMTLFGEWIENIAFHYSDINAIAINNRGPNGPSGSTGAFAGGNIGWIVGLRVGHAALLKRWDWALGINYRYLESDATVDAFNDSDFGLGGTNVKGYTVFGALALSPRVALGLRWMSANQVAGPTFQRDIFQFDFNAKY